MTVQPFLTIATFPGQVIEVACAQCGRRNLHAKSRLARVYGDEIAIPQLLQRLTAECALRKNEGAARCRAAVRFPGTPEVVPEATSASPSRPSQAGPRLGGTRPDAAEAALSQG